jgi:hypothetical protein
MLDQTLVVRARLIKHLVEESCPIKGRGPCLIPVRHGNEVIPQPLLVFCNTPVLLRHLALQIIRMMHHLFIITYEVECIFS